MSTFVKIFIGILIIIALLGIIGYTVGKSAVAKISFSQPVLQGLDLQGLNVNDLINIAASGQTKTIQVIVAINIKNDNSFAIQFSSIIATLSYKGTIIAATTDSSWHTVPANGTLALSDTVNINLNSASINMLLERLKGNHPQIDYTINLKVFGISIPSQTDHFTL